MHLLTMTFCHVIFTHTCTETYTHIHACMHTCIQNRLSGNIHTHTTHAHAQTYTRVQEHVHLLTMTLLVCNIYIHTTHAQTNTHIHTCIYYLNIALVRSDENALHRVGMHVCGMANMDTSTQVRALAQRLAQLIFDVDA